MMLLKRIDFIVMLSCSGLIYVSQRLGVELPSVINNYVNDILAVPITLYIILAIVRYFKSTSFKLTSWMIVSVVIYYSIYFELYLAHVTSRYTGDVLDVFCYSIGGLFFYMIQRYSIP